MMDSQQLLAEYAQEGSDTAFRELVSRYVDLVYSTALRLVEGDTHRAEDVAQTVFVDLTGMAQKLSKDVMLGGWLHRHTCFVAAKIMRSERRRQSRERQAVEMNALQNDSEADFSLVAPMLDEAINELGEADRTAILLRFFEQHDFRAVGQALGSNEDAARMRVTRALEKLEMLLKRRGVTASSGALAVVLGVNAVQAAPAGLAVTISTAAVLAGTAVQTSTVIAATKTIAMTTLQKTIIGATLIAAVGTGIYEARQASSLRTQVQTLQQQQAPLSEQLTELKTENERLSNLVAQAKDSQALSKAQFSELLKLRGKSGLAQTDSRELARLKSTLAQQTGKVPDFVNNAMAAGAAAGEKAMQKDALARLSRMKKVLNLTDDQEQAISKIMTNRIHLQAQLGLGVLTGKLTPEQAQAQAAASADNEAEIKALLTPDQLVAYPEYQQAEKTIAADTSATSDARQMANKFSLSKEQQEQLRALFYEMKLKETASALNEQAINQAKRSGNLAEAYRISIELEKAQLEEKLRILEGFLSPDQMTTYRQEQMDRINTQAEAMKMFLPQKPAGTAN